jgi:hypothetical protein
MKKLLLSLVLLICCMVASAQEYYVKSAGQGQGGRYLVAVTVNVKKKLPSTAEDLVMKYAVQGVMFRGLMAADGYGEQKPLIADPNVEQTKADFFQAFNNEGKYRNFASIVNSTLTSMKNKKTKMIETSAVVMVDKEALQHYLEEAHVIQGFSNLW